MTQTQRLWFREIWCYHISHIARTPIACISISGVFAGANISLQSQPAWSEAPPLLGRRSVLQVLSRSSITRGRGRRKEPSRRCSAGWSWKKKSKMQKLNCRQFSKIRCKDLRSNMNQLSWKDPWNNLPTLFLIDWALRQVLIAFWSFQRWRRTMITNRKIDNCNEYVFHGQNGQ